MVCGFALRGFQSSRISKETQTSKQLEDFLKHKCPRYAEPLFKPNSYIAELALERQFW
jgi:hypothetical protein